MQAIEDEQRHFLDATALSADGYRDDFRHYRAERDPDTVRVGQGPPGEAHDANFAGSRGQGEPEVLGRPLHRLPGLSRAAAWTQLPGRNPGQGRVVGSGYVLDFGLVKKLTKEIVDRLDERTLIPERSDCLRIEALGEQMKIRYEADEFILPRKDLCLLPIVHTSAEELARFIWDELRGALGKKRALGGITSLEIAVAEGPGQAAIYEAPV